MDEANPKRNSIVSCLAILAFPLVLGAGAYWFFAVRGANAELRQAAQTGLFEPYAALLKDGKYREAYDKFSAENYKKEYSADAFEKAFAERARRFGAVERFEIYSVQVKDMFGDKKRSQAFVRVYFAGNASYALSYMLIPNERGEFRIDSSAVSLTSTRYTPEPW